MRFYSETTKQHFPGKELSAPANPKIWHWKLLTELDEGDVIYHIYTKGKSRILGKATVAKKCRIEDTPKDSKYYPKIKKRYYVPLRSFKKFDPPIVIDDNFRKEIKKVGYMKYSPFNRHGNPYEVYLAKLNRQHVEVFRKILKGTDFLQKSGSGFGEIRNLLLGKKQIILFGPPGTGKTFKTKGYSVLFLTKGQIQGNHTAEIEQLPKEKKKLGGG